MEITVLVNKYRRLILKAAPLLVMALVWLWFVLVILVISSQDLSLRSLFGWGFMA